MHGIPHRAHGVRGVADGGQFLRCMPLASLGLRQLPQGVKRDPRKRFTTGAKQRRPRFLSPERHLLRQGRHLSQPSSLTQHDGRGRRCRQPVDKPSCRKRRVPRLGERLERRVRLRRRVPASSRPPSTPGASALSSAQSAARGVGGRGAQFTPSHARSPVGTGSMRRWDNDLRVCRSSHPKRVRREDIPPGSLASTP